MMEEKRGKSKMVVRMPDVVLEVLMSYIDDPADRAAISLVCKRWYELDALSRKQVTIAFCYTTTPKMLWWRFPHLESLKLKGKPRASMFNLIPENWGGYVAPWVGELAQNFSCLKSLHFRRMMVYDFDLEVLARCKGRMLQSIKLDKCSEFSTHGLLHLTRSCRNLKTLFLEESSVEDCGDEWLHELALNNNVLETLNFYMTELKFNFRDLEVIARNCRNLKIVKISDCEVVDLVGFFRAAAALEKFCGGCFSKPFDSPDMYSAVSLPPRLRCLGLTYMEKNQMSVVYPIASQLRKLDLLYSFLDTEDHCLLIQKCPNLEVLETRDVIGDRGLEVLAQNCKRLKRLRIERGEDGAELEDEEGIVSQRGLSALAQGCLELEYLAAYVTDISNASLELMGSHLKNLSDFRLVLLDRQERITDLPLDNGVRALLIGCKKLRRFALYLRPGGLTDVGLSYIGQYSHNVRWMLLGYVGETDAGLLGFSRGCPSLEKLEMRGCFFSEHALALAVLQLTALRYLWLQGYKASATGCDILAMARPFWNIELIPASQVVAADGDGEPVLVEHPAHILAYYSLAGPRDDCPETVVALDTESLVL